MSFYSEVREGVVEAHDEELLLLGEGRDLLASVLQHFQVALLALCQRAFSGSFGN